MIDRAAAGDTDAKEELLASLVEYSEKYESAAIRRALPPAFSCVLDNHVSTACAAWPERLVLVDAEGRIAYPGSPGPFGFSPEEAEEKLVALLGGAT